MVVIERKKKNTFDFSNPIYMHYFHQDWWQPVRRVRWVYSVPILPCKIEHWGRESFGVCTKTCFSISKVLLCINNELLIGHLNLLRYGNNRECSFLYLPPSIHRAQSMDNWSKYFLELNPSQNEHKIDYSLVACDISWATWVNYSCMSPLGLSIIQYVLFNFRFQAGKLTMYTCLCQ